MFKPFAIEWHAHNAFARLGSAWPRTVGMAEPRVEGIHTHTTQYSPQIMLLTGGGRCGLAVHSVVYVLFLFSFDRIKSDGTWNQKVAAAGEMIDISRVIDANVMYISVY